MLEQIVPLPPFFAPLLGVEEAPRRTVEWIIEQLIESLDSTDGDADLEETGDEDDGLVPWWAQRGGPGCPISDPGGCEHDGRELENGC